MVTQKFYVAPERLTNENFISHLKKIEVSLFVVDEAHCISSGDLISDLNILN